MLRFFFIKIIMIRIREYTPLKLEGEIFGFKKKKKKTVLLHTVSANYIGANYPIKNENKIKAI